MSISFYWTPLSLNTFLAGFVYKEIGFPLKKLRKKEINYFLLTLYLLKGIR